MILSRPFPGLSLVYLTDPAHIRGSRSVTFSNAGPMNGRLGYLAFLYRPPNSCAIAEVPVSAKAGPITTCRRAFSTAYRIAPRSAPVCV